MHLSVSPTTKKQNTKTQNTKHKKQSPHFGAESADTFFSFFPIFFLDNFCNYTQLFVTTWPTTSSFFLL